MSEPWDFACEWAEEAMFWYDEKFDTNGVLKIEAALAAEEKEIPDDAKA